MRGGVVFATLVLVAFSGACGRAITPPDVLTGTSTSLSTTAASSARTSPEPSPAAPPSQVAAGPWPRATNLAYDSSRGQVVLFGGMPSFVTNDTWTWDGNGWTQRTSASNPSARHGAALADDPDHHVVVLFGGGDFSNPLADTWLWNGSTWSQASPMHSPTPRTQAAMAYDPVRHRMVLFGGYGGGNETWTWDGADWTQKTPATSPSGRQYGRLAFDVARGNIVLFGGFDGLNDTWTWDGTTWTKRNPANTPPGLKQATAFPLQMVYDAERKVIVLVDPTQHSAETKDNTMDTWTWDGTTWTRLAPATSPPARDGFGLAYDALHSVTVFAGGFPFGSADDKATWGWDGVNWMRIG